MEEGKGADILVNAGLVARPRTGVGMGRATRYDIECYGSDGELKWSDYFHNQVVDVGLSDSLNKHFKQAGSAYTGGWQVGITGSVTGFSATDTMSAHVGWVEAAGYTGASRPVLTLGTVGGGSADNSAAKASFSIDATNTISGAFLCDAASKAGATGILYGGGSFAGRAVLSGDTLNVTVTLTAITI